MVGEMALMSSGRCGSWKVIIIFRSPETELKKISDSELVLMQENKATSQV